MIVLPLAEVDRKRMVHPVQSLKGSGLCRFTFPDECLELVEGFRNNGEIAVLEEERDDAFLHVRALLSSLRLQEFVDELRCVAHLDKLTLHGLSLS